MNTRSVAFFFVLCFAVTGALHAEEPNVQQLLIRMTALETKVSQLESRLAMAGHIEPAKETAAVPYAPPTSEGLVKTLEDIHLGGYLSSQYNLNMTSPLPDASSGAGPSAGAASGSGNNTNLRAFDRDANSFLHNLKLALDKPAGLGGAGFRTDLMFGRDAQILNSITTGDATDNTYVEQAYVNYVPAIGRGVEVKAGRFVGLAGAEVIESKDNWNTSRSLLYTNAQPSTHNGLLASYQPSRWLDLKAGIANGWDAAIDNNKSKTFLSQAALHPVQGVDFTNSFLYGSEQPRAAGGTNTDSNYRGLWDSILSMTPIRGFDRWKVLLNWDYGWEERAPVRVGSGNSVWHGLAAATKYDVNERLTLAGRWEYFSDPDGARTSGLNGLTPTQKAKLFEMTYTVDVRLHKNLITRFEYRFDWADEELFDLSDNLAGLNGARQTQQTLGAEAIYTF